MYTKYHHCTKDMQPVQHPDRPTISLCSNYGQNYTMKKKTRNNYQEKVQSRRQPPRSSATVLLRKDLRLRDQLRFTALCLLQTVIRLQRNGNKKHKNTRPNVAKQTNITFLKPSTNSGSLCPVQGTPPTFIPNTVTLFYHSKVK